MILSTGQKPSEVKITQITADAGNAIYCFTYIPGDSCTTAVLYGSNFSSLAAITADVSEIMVSCVRCLEGSPRTLFKPSTNCIQFLFNIHSAF
jgi:hypothetical protein